MLMDIITDMMYDMMPDRVGRYNGIARYGGEYACSVMGTDRDEISMIGFIYCFIR